MRSLVLILFLLPFSVEYVSAQKIQFENKVHNFGEIEEGLIPETTFYFKNVGAEPLVLEKVKLGCGCTGVSYSREPIKPKQKGFLKVSFNSNNYGGKVFNKSIIVVTNMKKNSIHTLSVKGNVLKKGKMPIVHPPVQIEKVTTLSPFWK